MIFSRFAVVVVCALALSSLAMTPLFAQDSADLADKVNAAQAKADEAALAGHNAWMLTCCALVLFMTAPAGQLL